jgi:putative thioredoxin
MTRPDPRLMAAMTGAVDLSALAARAKQPAQPAQPAEPAQAADSMPMPPPQTAPLGVVFDATEENFQVEVLQRSLEVPILIDFWAEWCGPCKQLSPVLEKLAQEGNGSWLLAKVDVDANQRLSSAFQIQSIPTVMAVVQGQLMEGFQGALPEAQLRKFVEALLKAAGAELPAGADGPNVDPRLMEADELLDQGDYDRADSLYEQVLAELPNDPIAVTGLAQSRLLRRTHGLDSDEVEAAAAANPDDVQAQLRAADMLMLDGFAEKAFDQVIDLVRRTSGDDRAAARDHLLGLFQLGDPNDPTILKARRGLANALF